MRKISQFQTMLLATLLAINLAACRGGDEAKARKSGDFAVVTEGQATGLSSTIAAPGETIPPVIVADGVTGTLVDTTTSLSILSADGVSVANLPPNVGGPGAIPATPSYGGSALPPASPQPAPPVAPSRGRIEMRPSDGAGSVRPVPEAPTRPDPPESLPPTPAPEPPPPPAEPVVPVPPPVEPPANTTTNPEPGQENPPAEEREEGDDPEK